MTMKVNQYRMCLRGFKSTAVASYQAGTRYLLGHWHIDNRHLRVFRVGLSQAITGWTAFGNYSGDFHSLAALEGAEGKTLPVAEGLHFQEEQAEINTAKLPSSHNGEEQEEQDNTRLTRRRASHPVSFSQW